LAGLIAQLSRIPDLLRIRYTTSHPNDMTEDLIAAHRSERALMPFLHLPVQSGSDRVLQAMNRKHRACDYRELVARIRLERPDIALSSDFIVGFPGETEAEFQQTLDLVSEVGFASSYFFKYSIRPGTPGAEFADQVPEDVKSERLQRLQQLADAQRRAYNAASVGKVMPVLFEKKGRHPGQHLIGAEALVEITGTSTNSLFGCLAERIS
jgi:tRNA-2-methylthio-N6-dimethylallyladenosine synthase